MTINALPPPIPRGSTGPSLESFRAAAQGGDWLHLAQDGSSWQVKASGATPSGRQVAWVEPQGDTTSAFVDALGQSFSRGIQAAVARELGLQPAPGRPLASRMVEQALEMAQTGQTALDGVDFFTRLNVSAKQDSAEFLRACKQLGLDPAGVAPAQRTQVDALMQQRFDAAAAGLQGPVSPGVARDWLVQTLREVCG